jgi:hypothetical protein
LLKGKEEEDTIQTNGIQHKPQHNQGNELWQYYYYDCQPGVYHYFKRDHSSVSSAQTTKLRNGNPKTANKKKDLTVMFPQKEKEN